MRHVYPLLALFSALLVVACTQDTPPLPDTLFEYLPAEQTGVTFENTVQEVPGRNVGTYDYMYNGGGVAIADLNNDGKPDLIFCGNDTPTRIYRNLGDMKFEDVTPKSGIDHEGWTTGVTVADLNNDGLLDLYFSLSGPDYATKSTANKCYINTGKFNFEERAKEMGIADRGLSTQALFFDYDGDGDLDLFVLNHAVRNWGNLVPDWLAAADRIPENERKRLSNTLYRNDGSGKFTDVSREAGITGIGFGLGVAVTDFNGDGTPDIFIANDYFVPDKLYLNLGNGSFSEESKRKFRHTSFFSMGCDAADFDNDGLVDLVVPDMSPNDHYRSKMLMAGMDTAQFRFLERMGYVPQYMFNALYRNNGGGVMSDIAHLAGVAKTDWSWAPLLTDLDNDGFKDLVITNGIYRDVTNNDWRLKLVEAMKSGDLTPDRYLELLNKAPQTPTVNAVFRNNHRLQFEAVNNDWGLSRTSFSQGMAVGDLDGDGDLDIVINNLGEPAFVIRNTSADRGAGFIRFEITAPSGEIPVQGARLVIHLAGGMQMAENRFTRGYQSFSEPIVHFGLGQQPPQTIDSLEVFWPNGMRSVHRDLETNQRHTIAYDGSAVRKQVVTQTLKPWWDISEVGVQPPAFHNENTYDDFRVEQLLPQRMSTLGPALAVGDVNGDGLDDFFLGGAKNNPAQLYVQSPNGFFSRAEFPVALRPELLQGEDLGALFMDVDGDGDLDLYIARGGGGDVQGRNDLLQDVLLLNDGRGNFTIARDQLPSMPTSTRAVAAYDFDGDGDLDLFVGGRNTPGLYPTGTRSYLLQNQNGRFVDVTEQVAPALLQPHMVTDAVWVDQGVGGVPNLVVVGEWMAPEVYTVRIPPVGGGSLPEFVAHADERLDQLHGWWYSVNVLDVEGENQLLFGNLGLNNKFGPTPEKPLFVFADDFDGNGVLDIVLSKNYQGQLVPVRGRMCSSAQMPEISDRFPSYDAFARAPLEQILGVEDLTSALALRVDGFASGTMALRTDGLGAFSPLPIEAQVAPIMGAVQFEGALVVAGNLFTTEVETTPYDAGKGLLLEQSAAGEWTPVSNLESGVFIPGDVRVALPIRVAAEGIPAVIAAANNGRVRIVAHMGDAP